MSVWQRTAQVNDPLALSSEQMRIALLAALACISILITPPRLGGRHADSYEYLAASLHMVNQGKYGGFEHRTMDVFPPGYSFTLTALRLVTGDRTMYAPHD